ncbi:MAG: argininosuccinate lyase [Bacillota bacterium]
MKQWGGRFEEQTDKLVEDFNASIGFDQRLYDYDIQGSKAHARMLARTGIISEEERDKIISGLDEIKQEIEEGKLEFSPELEDIHTVVETNLIEKIGSVGGKLHTARSRNDQVALDIRLFMRDCVKNIQQKLIKLMGTLLDLAGEYREYIMPGYTHLQRAQPITFGHHLLAYYFKLKRDYQKLGDNFQRINVLPLGAGALAGTSFPIDREFVARELDFDSVAENSLDAVSDRDFMLEFLSIASTIMMHLSRFSEELILWSSDEFDFVELADSYTTGSSIMPQKKNPDVPELVRGKTGRVYGHLFQLLTTMKGLPLAYNKDMQEDKEGVFDTVDTLYVILDIFPGLLETMEVNKGIMDQAARSGYTNATELANYLVGNGLSFRESHAVVGKAVLYALERGIELAEISPKEWAELFPEKKEIFGKDLYQALDVESCVRKTTSQGGPAPAETERIVEQEKKWLSTD